MAIRVLVVDDSAFMRHVISRELKADPQIEVLATATDGVQAVEKVQALQPDVVTLDVEMPRMDGLTALRQIMATRPTPVVMLSSLTTSGASATIEALQAGAVECLAKPSGSVSLDLASVRADLHRAVHAAALSRVRRQPLTASRPGRVQPRPRQREPRRPSTAGRPAARPTQAGSKPQERRPLHPTNKAVIIGSSTGGPAALAEVVPKLPADLPAAVAIVQHMPAGFTQSLAARLHDLSMLRVKEAELGDLLLAGLVLIAPGGHHLVFRPGGRVRLTVIVHGPLLAAR